VLTLEGALRGSSQIEMTGERFIQSNRSVKEIFNTWPEVSCIRSDLAWVLSASLIQRMGILT
jgi:hypothetical protein